MKNHNTYRLPTQDNILPDLKPQPQPMKTILLCPGSELSELARELILKATESLPQTVALEGNPNASIKQAFPKGRW